MILLNCLEVLYLYKLLTLDDMAKIIPKLNLNKHPQDVDNNSLVDAVNIRVSNYSNVLQSEEAFGYTDVYYQLNNIYDRYKIVHVINCLNELIFFIDVDDDTIHIARYNETLNECKEVALTEYFDKMYDSCYVYNNENLIIFFSANFVDYENSPLHTINLGSFDKEYSAKEDSEYTINQSICPKVYIPTIELNTITGTAYKGNYFIFVRFKINENDYTQWFNTNAHKLLDNTVSCDIIDYYISSSVENDEKHDKTSSKHTTCSAYISNTNNFCNKTLRIGIDKIKYYDYYQIGIICIRKDYTKCFRSNDIEKSNLNTILNFDNYIEYDATEMIKSYSNYYNVGNICTSNERIYIANYDETNDNLKNGLSNIDIDIELTTTSEKEELNNNEIEFSYTLTYKTGGKEIKAKWSDNLKKYYVLLKDWPLWYVNDIFQDSNPFDSATQENYPYVKLLVSLSTDINNKREEFIKDAYNNIYVVIDDDRPLLYLHKDDDTFEQYGKTNYNNNYITVHSQNNESGSTNGYYYNIYGCCDQSSNDDDNNEYFNISKTPDETVRVESEIIESFMPNEYYNFFIHFVDMYGYSTKGYHISKFNVNSEYYDKNKKLVFINKQKDIYYYLSFKLSSIPKGYIGYYVSMEKLKRTIIHKGIAKIKSNTELYFYNDKINYEDSIKYDFDKIRLYKCSTTANQLNSTVNIDYNSSPLEYSIDKKNLYVADTFNNILKSTNIYIKTKEDIDTTNKIYYAELIKFNIVYDDIDKTLIPCSNICYNSPYKVNLICYTYRTLNHAIVWVDNVYYDNTSKYFKYLDATGNSVSNSGNGYILNICIMFDFNCYDDTVAEYISINNSPVVTFFPMQGLDETNYKKKSFAQGYIVECKNTVDLFQQKHSSVFDMYPKIMVNYNEDKDYKYHFNNVIRRSNIFQNESDTNNGRWFDINQYKYITFKKGDITNILHIGNQLIVHTEHSIFVFINDNTLSTDDKNIQLKSIDIWDVDYKELIPTELGYGGINDNSSWTCGVYGYIYYSKDDKRIYRYDNGKFDTIDNDILNYIYDLNAIRMIFVEDTHNSRIIIEAFDKNEAVVGVFSYSYKYGNFISRHDYDFRLGYNTKENIYLIQNNNEIKNYISSEFQPNTIKIMLNANYELLQYVEYLKYKIYQIDGNGFIIENHSKAYHPEITKIITDLCNTGDIDTSIKYNDCNKPMDYKKPYWRMGNWHFNALRNNIAVYDSYSNDKNSDVSSRIYGNWFVIEFRTNSTKRIEYETMDIQTKIAEIL